MELECINKIRLDLEHAANVYYEVNKKYYKSVLKFLNKIFCQDANSIYKIKITKITLNSLIFERYNNIITKYKLSKELFNTNTFDMDSVYEFSEVVEIALIMTNNLLEKLNYKLYHNPGNKIKFKIVSINK